MNKITLHFKNPMMESLYKLYRWNFNKFPCKMLYLFNLLVQITLVLVIDLKYADYMGFLYSFTAMMFLLIFYKIYIKYKSYYLLQDLYIVISILLPFMIGTYFGCKSLCDRKKTGFEYYLGGFTFQMFFSYLYKFRINWYNMLISKMIGYVFLIIMDMIKNQGMISDQSIVLCFLTISSLYFDYAQDKNDRLLWDKEYVSSKENEIFHNLLEEIPDQVIIWSSQSKVIYANKSTFQLFESKNYDDLRKDFLNKVEIIEFQTTFETNKEKSTCNFCTKINDVLKSTFTENLGFIGFSAHIKSSIDKNQSPLMMMIKKKSEFDIKMKKVVWENEDAVMVFLSKVDEKNLNSRLEYVNSFLNYVLGNVSHDIYTPLNVLLGMLENVISYVKDPFLLNLLFVAKNNGEILLNIIRIMIDLFNIRKGSIILNIGEIPIKEELTSILDLFKEILEAKKIKYNISADIPLCLNNDVYRFKQIIIALLSNGLKTLQNGDINFNIRPNLLYENLYEVSIELFGKVESEHSSPRSFKSRLYNQPFFFGKSSEIPQLITDYDAQFDLGMTFSMVDFIILCISSGKEDHLNIKIEDNSNTKETHVFYKFNIENVLSLENLTITDPFKENKTFIMKYVQLENRSPRNKLKKNSLSEFCSTTTHKSFYKPDLTLHQSPISSSLCHLWPNQSGYYSKSHLIQDFETLENINYPVEKSPAKVKNNYICFEESCKFVTKSEISKKIIILNADDFLYNLMVISNYCKTCGIEVIEANNGLEALIEAQKLFETKNCSFDFIFMDCDMPLMDGFEAAEKINEFYCNKNISSPPIIAITANVINDDITSKIKTSGMKELLIKPLGIEKFKEILHKYININLL